MTMSRTVTMKGNPLDLEGPELKVGDAAPVALLRKDLANDFDLSEASGKLRVYSVVPSLDTGICAAQTKRFNEEAAKLGDIQFYTISMDLPVAMSRFCGAEGIDAKNMMMLSDHKLAEFGAKYGVLVPSMRILQRAIFIAGKDDKIEYVEYVPEIASHPDYDAVLSALKSLA
ncbi:thiol peroxidase [bacterium]|nr:thiol peroxidase [bacterium]MCB9475433.1 thiol peroxidase [Deltaproteobacteria bacterium]MCB9478509.1 thiol peroxidase [Deltaproteobacteria bacterium]